MKMETMIPKTTEINDAITEYELGLAKRSERIAWWSGFTVSGVLIFTVATILSVVL